MVTCGRFCIVKNSIVFFPVKILCHTVICTRKEAIHVIPKSILSYAWVAMHLPILVMWVQTIGVSRRKCLEGQRRGRQLLDSKYMWCRKGMHIS